MKERAKRYGAYLLIAVGFYLCSCLVLSVLNLIGIGNFDNILGDGFLVALAAGVMLLVVTIVKRLRSKAV